MDHTTTTDTDALLAEVDALLEETAATDARIEALLRTGSLAVVMADLALQILRPPSTPWRRPEAPLPHRPV